MSKLDEIKTRWAAATPEPWVAIAYATEDIRFLMERIETLEAAIKTHQVERAENLPKLSPIDDFDAKLYAVLEQEVAR